MAVSMTVFMAMFMSVFMSLFIVSVFMAIFMSVRVPVSVSADWRLAERRFYGRLRALKAKLEAIAATRRLRINECERVNLRLFV